jgi:hypothetical protein
MVELRINDFMNLRSQEKAQRRVSMVSSSVEHGYR